MFFSCSTESSPPTNTVDVHLIMGQSNSIGRAYAMELPKDLQKPLDSCYIYNPETQRFEVMQAGVNTQSVKGMFGPVVKAAQLLSEHKQQKVYFVVTGYGNTQLYHSGSDEEKDWHPESKELTQQALTTIDQARKKLEAEGKTVVFKSITWWQGERDAMNTSKAMLYEANETAFLLSKLNPILARHKTRCI
ncbi:sialate O-acetylesterase [Pontibacter rugosus]